MQGWITQITQLTPDVRSFHIRIPDRPAYRPGQFLMLTVDIEGKVRRRAYSIASPPHWENVELLIRLVPGGKVTPVLFSKQVGDELSVQMPYGTFYLDDPLPRKVVLLAGGVGLSAVIAMARHLEWIHYNGEATLIYGNRTPDHIIHKEELDRLSHDWRLKVVHTIDHPEGTGWTGEIGYITEDLLLRSCDPSSSTFYICGPPLMVGHTVEVLEKLGVSHEHIRYEPW
jgi:NAD(P)H-flavin reductase